jgi:hypothetical protein
MPQLAATLKTVTDTLEGLRAAETDLEEARTRFRDALRDAHTAGHSYATLGRAVGLTRQRVARIIESG